MGRWCPQQPHHFVTSVGLVTSVAFLCERTQSLAVGKLAILVFNIVIATVAVRACPGAPVALFGRAFIRKHSYTELHPLQMADGCNDSVQDVSMLEAEFITHCRSGRDMLIVCLRSSCTLILYHHKRPAD